MCWLWCMASFIVGMTAGAGVTVFMLINVPQHDDR